MNERSVQQSTAATPSGKRSAILLAFLLTLPSLAAQAQTAAPPPADAPPPPPPPAPMPPPPTPPMAPPVAAPSAVEATTKPPTASETMAATRPEVLPPIDVGAWVRAGSVFQKPGQPSSIADWHMDNADVELHAGGKVHEKVGVTLNLTANLLSFNPITPVAIEDAIISFDFFDPFHLWVGHLLVPVDRSNGSGPFFMIPWNYPGFLSVGAATVVAAPQEGPSGRNNGAVVWGEFNGGQFKYLAGAFDNGNVNSSPLFSGRLNLAIIGKEPGFWGNGSYFGDKDVLDIGVGGQFQKHGSSTATADKDYGEVNADILAEFKAGLGWVTGEAAYYHFVVQDMNAGAVKDSFYVLGAIASGVIGVGHIQPMVRFQWANTVALPGSTESSKAWNVDAGLSYLIKGPALRVLATYGHTKIPDPMTGDAITANSVQLGAQAIFF